MSIGLVANIFNEVHALPGWLETHLPFFDDVRVYHAGPRGEYSNDGTIELLEKWRVPITFGSIDDGFGAVRTRAIRSSPCEYVAILDADERFYPVHRVLTCTGEPTPHSEVDDALRTYSSEPDWLRIGQLGSELRVDAGPTYDQGAYLRKLLEGNPDAVVTVRRHWHDFSFKRPTQSWVRDPDWQMRIVRNDEQIHFDSGTRMHERLVGAVKLFRADIERGPFFDHFHFPFKRMELDQRKHDVAVYNAIHEGRTPPTHEEFNANR